MSTSTLESTIVESLEIQKRSRQLFKRIERASAVQIGKEIRRLRAANGLSQQELAQMVERSVCCANTKPP
jgi:ribosome-binding protein aMBF1 (putative translation factor)